MDYPRTDPVPQLSVRATRALVRVEVGVHPALEEHDQIRGLHEPAGVRWDEVEGVDDVCELSGAVATGREPLEAPKVVSVHAGALDLVCDDQRRLAISAALRVVV